MEIGRIGSIKTKYRDHEKEKGKELPPLSPERLALEEDTELAHDMLEAYHMIGILEANVMRTNLKASRALSRARRGG